ncbi:L-asparaginase precursor [Zopfia rhizophila CBS 207.26]|uniref:L-asparaginase n=1 Tax=Zopfia rhizophila CBS 207.26 TaxID=1314779 RepID=A0A6A6EV83_9PEZI|nr:L-asparaginase precursor [Zopfia rhizophila CBS 207.26]
MNNFPSKSLHNAAPRQKEHENQKQETTKSHLQQDSETMSTPSNAAAPSSQPIIKPRIIIHGGAGNITRSTLNPAQYESYKTSLRTILASSADLLSKPGATALDVATHAVSMLEDDPHYNSGKGAVFTRAGTQELECSIMVSSGYRKRGVSCMLLRHVKNPIKLARELLIRGEEDDGGGAKDHCEYSGPYIEALAEKWGLEIVDTSYFFTQKKWDEHMKGLEKEKAGKGEEWEMKNYIPLGTCGAVVLDSFGTVCAATSTGGLTNKIPGRIGDTPTMGAGYWAEEWFEDASQPRTQMLYQAPPSSSLNKLSRGDIPGLLTDCLPITPPRIPTPASTLPNHINNKPSPIRHAVGMSSSGNGDTFVRMVAARTVAAKSRFTPNTSLSKALSWMTGPNGELQKSAGDRWGKVHEGVGGIIGIELVGTKGTVVCNYNCGGMYRAWTEEDGDQKCLIFRDDNYESGPEGWGVLGK